MSEKLRKKMQKAGFNAQILRYQTGTYYDGTTEHGFCFDKLFISPESWTEHEIAMKAAKRMLRGPLKDEYIIEPLIWSMSFCIVARKDARRAEEAGTEGKIFLDTYHQYLHDNAPHNERGLFVGDISSHITDALQAGAEAVRRWKAS